MKKLNFALLLILLNMFVVAQIKCQRYEFLNEKYIYNSNGYIDAGYVNTPDKKAYSPFSTDWISKTGTQNSQFSISNHSINRLNINAGSPVAYNAEMGYSLGVGKYPIDFLKFTGVVAYKFSPNMSLGFGTGLKYALDIDDAIIPFYASFRYYTTRSTISLYLGLDTGYSLDVTSDYKTEGFYFFVNPSAGVRIKFSESSDLHIGLGYEMQKFKLSYALFNAIPGSVINASSIGITAGITF